MRLVCSVSDFSPSVLRPSVPNGCIMMWQASCLPYIINTIEFYCGWHIDIRLKLYYSTIAPLQAWRLMHSRQYTASTACLFSQTSHHLWGHLRPPPVLEREARQDVCCMMVNDILSVLSVLNKPLIEGNHIRKQSHREAPHVRCAVAITCSTQAPHKI